MPQVWGIESTTLLLYSMSMRLEGVDFLMTEEIAVAYLE